MMIVDFVSIDHSLDSNVIACVLVFLFRQDLRDLLDRTVDLDEIHFGALNCAWIGRDALIFATFDLFLCI